MNVEKNYLARVLPGRDGINDKRLLRRLFELGFFGLQFPRLSFRPGSTRCETISSFCNRWAVCPRDIDLMRAFAAAGKADIGHHRLAGAVDDAADHRNRHRRRDVRQALFQHFDRLDDIEILPRAGRAGNDRHAAAAQAQRFQHFITDATSSTGSAESDTRIVSPMPDHNSMPRPIELFTVPERKPPASVMPICKRVIASFGQRLIGRDGEENIRRLDADLEIEEIVIFENFCVAQRAFDHRVGAGLAVFFQQILFQRSGIDADAHGAAVILGGLTTSRTRSVGTDIARIDAQAGRTGFGGFDAALVMEMDVGDDGNTSTPLTISFSAAVDSSSGHDTRTISAPAVFELANLLDRRLARRSSACWSWTAR